jgi:peptidoglycan/LPS O-acetylase OafA/YrhL
MITLKYRPEIDGLRAFAVLAVIGFHYFPAIIGGGFVGVDVFFVISGYLISSIIYKNLDLHCFNFLIFYQHRIRRIYPALILVIGCSLMAGSFLLFPDELAYLGKHILGGTLFISNIVLWNESGYFDKITQTKILMHLWSLGVEEQFYLLWPIILTFIWKTEKRLAVIALLCSISFAYCILRTYTFPATAFFSPLSRFWELGAGGIIAYLELYKTIPFKSHTASINLQISILIGLLLIGPILFFNEAMKFPGFIVLLPVFGSILILRLAMQKDLFITKILSTKGLVYLGKISYPLYLWHWPILSFMFILEGEHIPVFWKFSGIFFTFMLSAATYSLVEQPLRRGSFRNAVALWLLTCSLILGIYGAFIYHPDSYLDLISGKTL